MRAVLRGVVAAAVAAATGCTAAQGALPATVSLASRSPERVRLVVIGDTGIFDGAVRDTCEADATPAERPTIALACRDALLRSIRGEQADAVLALGDLVYELGPVCPAGTLTAAAERRFDALILPLARATATRLVLALGNHDVHHRDGGHLAAEACYLAYARKHADELVFPERNFVIETQQASLVVLDTNRPITARLAAAIEAEIRRQQRPWVVMAAHHVWRTYGDKPDEAHGPTWARALGRDPDLWLNGHAHFLQLGVYAGAVNPARTVAAVTSGAAGKLRPQTECAHPDAAAPGLPPCAEAGELFGRSRYGYAVVELSEAAMRVTFKDVTGKRLFAWERGRDGGSAVLPP